MHLIASSDINQHLRKWASEVYGVTLTCSEAAMRSFERYQLETSFPIGYGWSFYSLWNVYTHSVIARALMALKVNNGTTYLMTFSLSALALDLRKLEVNLTCKLRSHSGVIQQ